MAQRGFFTTATTKAVKGQNSCLVCKLDKNCITPHMQPTGTGKTKMLVMAEAPGRLEDERGEQLIGDAGQTLRGALKDNGINLDDCRKLNAVNCRPPKNRTPTDEEIDCCRANVWKEITELKPHVILLCGMPAVKSFLAHRWPDDMDSISKWRGWAIPDRDTGAWVVPTFHPSYVNRMDYQPVVELIFEQDVKKAVDLLRKPFPEFTDDREKIIRLNPNESPRHMQILTRHLERILELSQSQVIRLAFDFEATGRKPQAQGHRIRCMSMCYSPDFALSFIIPSQDSPAFVLILRILANPRILKSAHNLKFEDSWTWTIWKTRVRGWWLDTMNGAHILDNRSGITGLKFQVYANFGVFDYSSHMKEFFEAKDKKNANAFNRIFEVPEDELLLYCGLDSLYEFMLAEIQAKELELDG